MILPVRLQRWQNNRISNWASIFRQGREFQLDSATRLAVKRNGRGNPPDAFVYQLASRGVRRAREYGFADGDYRYTRDKSNLFLLHDLLITRFHLELELALRGKPLELLLWEQRRSVLLDSAENGHGRLSVNPDVFFGLKHREKPEGQNATYFFLEIVRSRESEYERGESNFMRKMEAFLAYY